MTTSELEMLNDEDQVPQEILDVTDLKNKKDRTLLYGYTCDRLTWHVYLLDAEIYTVMYRFNGPLIDMPIKSNRDFVPNKRLYPAMCDFEFCCLLKKRGVSLCFTTYTPVKEEMFYGEWTFKQGCHDTF